MSLFNQPLRVYIRTTAVVAIFSVAPHLAVAQTPHPSIRETARKEAARMVRSDSKSAAVSRAANYPPLGRPSTLNTNTGRRATLITLGALGGLLAGYKIGSAIGCIHDGEDCELTGLVSAPVGAIAAGITVAVLTR